MRRVLQRLRDWLKVLTGLLAYLITGRTPAASFMAMVNLHMASNGRSSALVERVLQPFRRQRDVTNLRAPDDALAVLSAADLESSVERLRSDGYAVLPQRIPPASIDRLRRFAESTPGEAWDAAGRITPQRIYDRSDARVAKLQLYSRDLVNQADIQDLAGDPMLVGIAQAYFGCAPVLDAINMWWSTPHLERPSDEIAQTFHVDCDRLRWLKVFIYLTDVDAQRGPHVFVRGSHRPELRDAGLMARGYVRISDDDIAARHGAERMVEICGPAGTVLIEDTGGFHKGVMPRGGDRLMLELQFSCSAFGANYERFHLKSAATPRLARSMRALPQVYEAFD